MRIFTDETTTLKHKLIMPDIPEIARRRNKPEKLRVTFPDGTVICYKRAVETFMEAIRKVGPERVASLPIGVRGYPLVSQGKIDLFRDNSRPLDDKWFVITEGYTVDKYIQLRSISEQLGLGLKIERAESFDDYNETKRPTVRKPKTPLTVTFPDGEVFSEAAPRDTYLKAILKIGPERLAQKGLEYMGYQIVTRFHKYPNQEEVAKNQWVTLYSTTAAKIKALKLIKNRMGVEMEWSTEE